MFIKLVQREMLSCEAIVRRMPNGDLLMVGQCGDVTEPAPGNRVYKWRSTDDGKTWSPRELITPEDGRAVYQTEVTVIDDKVFVFLTFHNGKFLQFEHRVLLSCDNGCTFANHGAIPFLEGFTFIRGAIKSSNGQWLFPFQHYPMTKLEDDELAQANKMIWDIKAPVVQNGVLFADDNGKFIAKSQTSDIPLFLDGVKRWVWSEPTMIELNNHELVMLMRVDKTGYLHESRSQDGGLTWSKPTITEIPNPSNKPKLLKNSRGDIVLINTPKTIHGMAHRHPLEVWISHDDMNSWSKKISLVTFPGWISYPDGFIEGNTLYLSFEFNRHDIYFLTRDLDN